MRTMLAGLPAGATLQGVALHHGSVRDSVGDAMRQVQAGRAVSERAFARVLSAELDNPNLGDLANVSVLVRLQSAYWTLVVRLLPRRS